MDTTSTANTIHIAAAFSPNALRGLPQPNRAASRQNGANVLVSAIYLAVLDLGVAQTAGDSPTPSLWGPTLLAIDSMARATGMRISCFQSWTGRQRRPLVQDALNHRTASAFDSESF